MSDTPSPPWRLECAWCEFYLDVYARGMRAADPGAGVEAANIMREHVEREHDRTWREFLLESERPKELTRRLEQS